MIISSYLNMIEPLIKQLLMCYNIAIMRKLGE